MNTRTKTPVVSPRSARPGDKTPVGSPRSASPGDKTPVGSPRSARSVSPTTPTTAKRCEEAEIAKIAEISVVAIDKIAAMIIIHTRGASGSKHVNKDNIQTVVEHVIAHSKRTPPERVEDIFLLVCQKATNAQLKSFSTPHISTDELADIKAALNYKGNKGGGSRKPRRRAGRGTKGKSRSRKNAHRK